MPVLGFLGALLLLGSFGYVGYALVGVEHRRVRQTEGFLLLLRHIRNGIVCFSAPIEEIYAGFQNESLEECGFLPALRQGGFAYALQACRHSLLLEAEELHTLSAFAGEVGKSYSREQASICDYTMGELEQALRHRREEAPRRARAAASLALCAGLALLILLL
jgi:stage III sporulation protein AB